MSQRFSDAELAAEYWRNEWLYERLKFTGGPEVVQCDRQSETLHRFATLPHTHEPEPKTVYVYDTSGRCIGNFPRPDNWTE